MILRAEPITPAALHHGEGPFWDDRTGRLLCMDVLAGDVLAVDQTGSVTRHLLPTAVATIVRRRRSGGFVIADRHGLIGADEHLSAFERLADLTADPHLRTNDGGCDPLGGFVLGTMAQDETPHRGAVYRVAIDHQVTELLAPVSISNGIQWSADGARAFYVDTPTRRIDVFDVNPTTGAWSNRRTHVDLTDVPGYPDGLAIDEDDGLWVALWGGSAVNHYDVEGRLIKTVSVPEVTQVSSCAFGGHARDILYITTSRQGLAPDCEPLAGAVFGIQTRSRGAALHEFAG